MNSQDALTSIEMSPSLFVHKATGTEEAGGDGDEEKDESDASNNAHHDSCSESHKEPRR